MIEFRARHYQTGNWVRFVIEGRTLADVRPVEGSGVGTPVEDWVAPAFWDIQTNGRLGISFSDSTLTPAQVAEIVRAQGPMGTARLCPTLISAPFEATCQGLAAIARACDEDDSVGRRVAGVHLEGPYLSERDGYRGAHPRATTRDPDWDEFQRFQDAAGGRIVLMTLAPERSGALAFIGRAVGAGVRVALGHTSAEGETLRRAIDAGATLSTHLGNGIASPLPRHPNPIWEQAADDRLFASVIADGHHLDPATLRVLVRAKTPARTILVSDASPLAGLPPGTYGEWAVDPSGKVVVAGTPYLAGSNRDLGFGLGMLLRAAGLGLSEAIETVTTNPARFLGRPEPALAAGQPANLVIFRHNSSANQEFQLLRTCVDGEWFDKNDAAPGG